MPPLARFLTLRSVASLLSISRRRLLAWIESGRFPRPVVLPDGLQRWRLCDVIAWTASGGGQLDAAYLGELRDVGGGVAVDASRRGVDASSGELSDAARDILQVLQEAGPDARLSGATLAAKASPTLEHTSGTFRRAIDELKEAGLIESGRDGYWLTAAGLSLGRIQD